MGKGQLIAVYVSADDPHNVAWSKERYAPRRSRWTVRVRGDSGNGVHGIHPTLSRRMFRSYSAALRAIASEEG